MINEMLFAIWFFAPAGFANATPVIFAALPGLKNVNAPMDFGKMYKGQRIFGEHKTWRGLIGGMVVATLILWIQQICVAHFAWAQNLTEQVDYLALPTLILGPIFGLGALGGDAIESFFKRQRHIPPGHGWFPFDQTDYIIGGAIATVPFVQLTFRGYIALILFWLAAHMITTYIGYLLGLRARPI